MIQNFGGGEIIVIIIIALVVLGPDRLPEMARSAGRMLHKFRTMTSGLQGQVRDVMDDPAMKPLKELGEFAARPRQKLSEYALEAEADERAKAEKESLVASEAVADPDPPETPQNTRANTPGDDTDTDPTTEADGDTPEPPAPVPVDPAPIVAADVLTPDAVDPTERESA